MKEVEGHKRSAIPDRVLLVIIDGYGFDPEKERIILEETAAQLGRETRCAVLEIIEAKQQATSTTSSHEPEELLLQAIAPTPLSMAGSVQTDVDSQLLVRSIKDQLARTLTEQRGTIGEAISSVVRTISRRQNYAIWTAKTPYIFSLRQEFPTIVTKTSGLEVGYEPLTPEVQGNSETGHQQLGNLCVASQPPLEISRSINDGTFFANKALTECLEKVCAGDAKLNLSFLLSGEYGDDGRVHSCWNHLEAFLDLCFVHFKMAPSKLRIQAILDGRDCPPFSSLRSEGKKYNFLGKLKALLERHNASDGLAWIIGRSIGMDRDYDEVKAQADYELLTQGKGEVVQSFEEAMAVIEEKHASGVTDPEIQPIAICDREGAVRRVEAGDVFVDLNFRADRQRPKIASMLCAKPFLLSETSRKQAQWKLDWLDPGLEVDVYCLTEYHPEFREKYGAKVAFLESPHEHNFLEIATRACKDLKIPFKYLLLAESTKALHVGYFIRGRRERLSVSEPETRVIIPSYGAELGVNNDNDFYKVPQMRAFEIAGTLTSEMYKSDINLAIVNFSNPDMLGHLITHHFHEAVESIEVMDIVLRPIIAVARRLGFSVILTSDHGNIDDFSPAHGSNDVLTTFIFSKDGFSLRNSGNRKARLFDLSWSALHLLGLREKVAPFMPPFPEDLMAKDLTGKSLLDCRDYRPIDHGQRTA